MLPAEALASTPGIVRKRKEKKRLGWGKGEREGRDRFSLRVPKAQQVFFHTEHY